MSADHQPPVPAANDEQSQLTALKSLLLGPEQSEIRRLQQESHDPEIQRHRVAATLTGSLHQAYGENPQDLTRALESPVAECIETVVQRKPGYFADILYPVMGPAIRRSISQALKGLVQQINQTLEHSLTLKGLSWRLEAARSGIPFAEIVLRHNLRYRVDEAFLIQNGSGLLIQHVSQGAVPDKDADAVSAMLTAIRDFAHDTLDRDNSETRLETVDIGEHTLWLMHGPRAYLACAIRGMPPVSLRDELAALVTQIHRQHGTMLEYFDGDTTQAVEVVPLLETALRSEMAERSRRRFPWPLLIVGLLFMSMLAWWAHGLWQASQASTAVHDRREAAIDQLAAAPGIVVTARREQDGLYLLQGLHDPLTPTPRQRLTEAGLTVKDFRLQFRPFESSEPGAALARAQRRLAPPPGVELTLHEGGILRATGSAATDWVERADLLATTVPGIEAFDHSGMEDNDLRLQRQLQAALAPPPDVVLTVEDGVATLSGQAPLAWIGSLEQAIPSLPGLRSSSWGELVPAETQRLATLTRRIEQTNLKFVSGTELDSSQGGLLATLAGLISEAWQHAVALGLPMRLEITGRTDGTGTPEQNLYTARQRAATIAQALSESDYAMPPLDLRVRIQPPDRPEPNAELRRVEIQLRGIPRPQAAR